MVPGWSISEMSAGGAKWEFENTPKASHLICILAPRSCYHLPAIGRLWPSVDDYNDDPTPVEGRAAQAWFHLLWGNCGSSSTKPMMLYLKDLSRSRVDWKYTFIGSKSNHCLPIVTHTPANRLLLTHVVDTWRVWLWLRVMPTTRRCHQCTSGEYQYIHDAIGFEQTKHTKPNLPNQLKHSKMQKSSWVCSAFGNAYSMTDNYNFND